MTIEQHTKIFDAYLARLGPTDIAPIKTAIDACWHAAMNLGTSSQVAAQEFQTGVVRATLEKMLEHDRNNIERIIKQNI